MAAGKFGDAASGDLTGTPERRKEFGYTTDSGSYVNDEGYYGPQETEAGFYGGRDYDIADGRIVPGSSGADRARDRLRSLGNPNYRPQAVQLNEGAANGARGLQLGGLANIRTALAGGAPSAASIGARLASEQSGAAGIRALGSARGPAGGIVAANRAGDVMGQQAVGTGSAALEGRAREAGADRSALVGGVASLRGQDIDAATTNAQLEARQREMDEQNQQYFERMGFDVDRAAQMAWLERKKQADQAAARRRAEIEADRKSYFDDAVTGLSTASSVASGGLSDRRTKNVYDMGSLGRIGGR